MSAPAPPPPLELRGLVCERPVAGRGRRRLVDDLSLTVGRGELLVLLGASGSGKTTTLRMINRLVEPTAGEVLIAGQRHDAEPPHLLRRRIGYVIQQAGLFPHLSVAENVAVTPALLRWPAERIAARVDELLALVGLPAAGFADRYPHQLSGGQRQRVGVARALAVDPPLVLLDEPFGALDPITRRELQREFRALQARLRKTAVFVTHDLREAALVADRLALLDGGRLLATGTAAELSASARPEVRDFLEAGAA